MPRYSSDSTGSLANSLSRLIRQSSCKDCVLHEQTSHVCLIGDGAYPADLMLVGEAPGADEEKTGKPFQGRAGKMLDSFLDTFGIDRGKIFISNAVHCRPTDNDTPDWKAIQACRKHLLREISYVKPKLIIALGGTAAKSILNRRSLSVSDTRRKRLIMPDTGIRTVVTYHPAGVLRNNYLMEHTVEDFEWAMQILAGEDDKPEAKIVYKYIENPWDVIKLKDVVAIDLETTALEFYRKDEEIRFFQICQTEGYSYMMPWNEKTSKWLKTAVMENHRITKVGHNIGFDMKWLLTNDILTRGPIFDTMIAGHLIDENLPEKSLDAMATQFTPVKDHKAAMHQWLKDNRGAKLVDAPLDILVPYGCGDTDATFRLYNIFSKKLRENNGRRTPGANLQMLFDFQMEVLRGPKLEMEYRGAKIDVALKPVLRESYENTRSELQDELHRRVTKTGAQYGVELNVNSPPQMKRVLYEQWDLPALGKPKQWGKPKLQNTAEDTIIKLVQYLNVNKPDYWRSKAKALELVIDIRLNRKMISHYIDGLDDFLDVGNRVHPSFKLHGTVTGRWSCSEPNLQQIPRTGPIKKLFISRFGERGAIFKCDLSQAELRFAAWIARELTMLGDLNTGKDIHKITAARVFKTRFNEVTDDQRKLAKTVNFGILYQAGKYKMAESMKTSEDAAQKFMDTWFGHYGAFKSDVRDVEHQIIHQGYVVAWSGRIRRTPVLEPFGKEFKAAVREAFNSRIQGGVSDYLVYGMLQLYKAIKKRKIKAYFIANVHDEFVIDTLKEHVAELNDLCVEIFTKRDLVHEYDGTQALHVRRKDEIVKVPIEIETAAGPNWHDVETLHGEKEVVKVKRD